MISLYPEINESQRPDAFSHEASRIRSNVRSSHQHFVGQSVYTRSLFIKMLRRMFDIYSTIWKQETIFSSSISEITNNSSYQAIIKLGYDIIPFIIDDLKKSDNHWFYALEAITNHNPIKRGHEGDVVLMKRDWIEWAEENNLTDAY